MSLKEAKIHMLLYAISAGLGWGLFISMTRSYYAAESEHKAEVSRLETVIKAHETGAKFREMRESFYQAESRIGELKRELHEQDRELTRLKAKLAVREGK